MCQKWPVVRCAAGTFHLSGLNAGCYKMLFVRPTRRDT